LYGSVGDVPYDDIDCEIRHLIRLLNQMPGIRTTSSCAGHSSPSEAYVAFLSKSQENLHSLLTALSELLGWKAGFEANRSSWRAVWVQASLHTEGVLQYHLRIDGHPKYAQRELIGKVENAISSHLAHTHPASAMCETHCNAGA
jgi:hypothetical protein